MSTCKLILYKLIDSDRFVCAGDGAQTTTACKVAMKKTGKSKFTHQLNNESCTRSSLLQFCCCSSAFIIETIVDRDRHIMEAGAILFRLTSKRYSLGKVTQNIRTKKILLTLFRVLIKDSFLLYSSCRKILKRVNGTSPSPPRTEGLVTQSRSTQTNRVNQSEMQPISNHQLIPLGANPPNLNDLI